LAKSVKSECSVNFSQAVKRRAYDGILIAYVPSKIAKSGFQEPEKVYVKPTDERVFAKSKPAANLPAKTELEP
jgi:hypothetical protein